MGTKYVDLDTPASSVISSFGPSLDENRPLLSRSTVTSYTTTDEQPSSAITDEQIAKASPFSGIFNLLNTILGTGMLAMPAAVATVGLLPGMVLTLISGIASGAGLYFLSESASSVEGRRASFFAVSQLTYPGAAVWFDTAIAIKCFGVAVSYLIIIGDVMPQVVISFDSSVAKDSILLDRKLWITAVMFGLLVPLSFKRTLDSFRHISALAILAVVYLCAIVIYYYFLSPDFPKPPPEDIELIHLTSSIFGKLPVFIFGFTCHQNLFSVHNELKNNSRRSMVKVILSSIITAGVFYELIAILGYLSFGRHSRGNIILEYPATWFVAGGRLAIVICVLFGYPLQIHPCRGSVDKILMLFDPSKDKSPFPDPPSTIKHFAMTTALLIGTYILAITVSELDLVLAFVGSTGSTAVSFILPGLFYFKLHEHERWTFAKISSLVLATFGFTVMTVCLSYNIFKLL
ncbi:transmembrane amino acid transporter protein-domain-containing protein [Zychaea mexicana]|uniref:transmembrane amino acid transporter protein-domain-containing protein n=1 Tax=Zychaea mexicana TaxID=64656 RepID=UPI0022FE118F|nr:transmembrane amino acid transporter protein-domain-containing protein [Zychaea mexicana]KAI9491862.1 transmembrane amino acid transporter protein-domain-containing protein [Zychaea mexicana]